MTHICCVDSCELCCELFVHEIACHMFDAKPLSEPIIRKVKFERKCGKCFQNITLGNVCKISPIFYESAREQWANYILVNVRRYMTHNEHPIAINHIYIYTQLLQLGRALPTNQPTNQPNQPTQPNQPNPPTSHPSNQPTNQPNQPNPTQPNQATIQPTIHPTNQPTQPNPTQPNQPLPTKQPSIQPTNHNHPTNPPRQSKQGSQQAGRHVNYLRDSEYSHWGMYGVLWLPCSVYRIETIPDMKFKLEERGDIFVCTG